MGRNDSGKDRDLEKLAITIHTGDAPGAGTDARVFMTLLSAEGAQEVELKKEHFYQNLFERNQTDFFEVTALPMSKVLMIKLRIIPGCCTPSGTS